jgi:DNA adenine methylase
MICDEDNLRAVHKVLQKVIILNGDFEETLEYANNNTLFYFDPPYKPLNDTSSFNSYSKDEFDDNEQIRLAKFCEKIDMLGHQWILSNSDVKGKNQNDNFFDELYGKFNIRRVLARRNINSNPDRRGELTELLITNNAYEKIMSVAQ